MKDIIKSLALLAALMDEKDVVEKLHNSTGEYLDAVTLGKSEEEKTKLFEKIFTDAGLFTMRFDITKNGIESALKSVDTATAAHKIFEVPEN